MLFGFLKSIFYGDAFIESDKFTVSLYVNCLESKLYLKELSIARKV